jgi:hypothetical protein
MYDKGIEGFIFSVSELVQVTVPILLLSIIDLITFPLRLVYNTLLPDSFLF